ncbi:siderophore-interacting protein [Xanthobacter sp. TB0139]|uniref:siderophore-interacting protein n=1 Tax=Xanthobacter sp. TB0139 TaxID=3459178 RepID=UPI004039A8D9
MGKTHPESVEDRQSLLEQEDHMRDMERIEMVVEKITRPVPSVARVTARITPTRPGAWRRPNLAIRIEVEAAPGLRPVSRIYTVRHFDEARSCIDIDFVIHEDDSPAMRWLKTAVPGTRTWLVGPRPHFLPHYESGRKVAIFADETAIPAVHAILKHWQQPAQGVIHIETTDPAAFGELPDVPGVERHLLLRAAGEAAGTKPYLSDAAKALPDPQGWTIWAAGERDMARTIRKLFMEQHGMTREDVRVFGYWRAGVSSSDIDRARLNNYSALRAKGQGMERLEDV